MKKIYHLSTCSTCKRIIKELNPGDDVKLQCIKTDAITEDQIDEMAKLAGNYESIFSRKAMKYRAWSLNEQKLLEEDYRHYILKEYTFLKRPVIIVDDEIFIGSSKKTTELAKRHF